MNRVLLIDDHVSFTQTLALMLEKSGEFEVVGQAASVSEARQNLLGVEAELAVVDLGLSDGFGWEVIEELRTSNPDLNALVLTATSEREQIARAVEAGAAGVVHKTAGLVEIVEAMSGVAEGRVLLPPEELVELLRLASREKKRQEQERLRISKLTPREIEVLKALAEGLNSEEIAAKMHVSVETERTHVVNILKKLGVHSRLEALVFAVRHGVVEIRAGTPRPPGSL